MLVAGGYGHDRGRSLRGEQRGPATQPSLRQALPRPRGGAGTSAPSCGFRTRPSSTSGGSGCARGRRKPSRSGPPRVTFCMFFTGRRKRRHPDNRSKFAGGTHARRSGRGVNARQSLTNSSSACIDVGDFTRNTSMNQTHFENGCDYSCSWISHGRCASEQVVSGRCRAFKLCQSPGNAICDAIRRLEIVTTFPRVLL